MANVEAALREMMQEEIQRALEPLMRTLAGLSSLGSFTPVRLAPRGRPGRKPGRVSAGGRCAVIGCPNDARSKGYCSAHYQKYRNLLKTGRAKEFGWKDNPGPQSVKNPTLPRGRAAVQAKKARKAA